MVLLGRGTRWCRQISALRELPNRFEVVAIAVNDLNKTRPDQVPIDILVDDLEAALAQPHDITIEVMGGLDVPCR